MMLRHMSSAEYLKQFAEPDPAYTPAPLWWWSGERLEIGRLRWQVDRLIEMGIRQVVIINLAPSGTLFGSDADDPPFLSEAWWDIFRQVCDYARQVGMKIWFYDQIGFSGASFQAEIAAAHPEFLAQQLKLLQTEGTGDLHLACPGGGTAVGAYLVTEGKVRPVELAGGEAKVTATRPSRLCLAYHVRQAYDLFSAAACDRLLDTVHREFARRVPDHIGSTIVGSFQDELPNLPTWGSTFADSFAAAFGYRLESVIHHLFEEGDATAARTRVHYHQHRAILAEEAFFKPFYRWHEEHGLACGFDQQSPAREGRAIGCVSKYADYLQTHRWYAIPGSDHHGNAVLHASLAQRNGHHRVWIEGFHSTGWGGTIADTFDWLLAWFAHGANFYNPHAVYYGTCKGWWDWAPPSTCWRQPYAMHYKPFADTIARLQKLLSRGKQQGSVGVLFPTTTVQSACGPAGHFADAERADRAVHEVIGSIRWHEFALGPLDRRGVRYHIIDEPSVGDAEFDVIILPGTTILHDATAKRLERFVRDGGKVIAVDVESMATPSGKKVEFEAWPNVTRLKQASEIPFIAQDVRVPVSALHRVDGDTHILFVPAVAGRATEVKWDHWNAPLEHSTIVPGRYLGHIDLELPTTHVHRFDPATGSSWPIEVVDGRLSLDFEGAPFAVLVWSASAGEKTQSTLAAPKNIPGQGVPLTGEWSCEYVPTLPDAYADIYDRRQPDLRWPHTSEFDWSGLGESKRVHATFGPRAWRTDGGRRTPIEYSPTYGIYQDFAAWQTLGPKGHVPEDFIDLGKLQPGDIATIRTGVVSPDEDRYVLWIGANGAKSAQVNGVSAAQKKSGYACAFPIALKRGENAIEITIVAEREATIRAFWCISKGDSAGVRPERIVAPSPGPVGSRVSFSRTTALPKAGIGGMIKVSTAAVASVWVDDVLLGRQGGFDPYRLQLRGQTYSLPELSAGEHVFRVETIDAGSPVPVMADAIVRTSDGDERLVTDGDWTVRRDGGEPVPAKIHLDQGSGGAAWYLYRRPHPLPRTTWLDGNDNSAVIDFPLAPPLDEPAEQTLAWTIPPGVSAMMVPLADAEVLEMRIDDSVVPFEEVVRLQPGRSRSARLRVRSRQIGGALLAGRVTYEFSAGIVGTKSWPTIGLRCYSGAMRMKQKVTLKPSERTQLDLGEVRGTVAVTINGQPAGVAVMRPYRFDLTGLVIDGENEIELLVTNTLANHQSTWSPSRSWGPDQLEAGVLGPVMIVQ